MANIQSVLSDIGKRIVQAISKPGRAIGIAWNFWIREVWPDLDKRTAIEDGYADNTALFTIVSTDAEKFASIPRYLYDAKSKNGQGLYTKPMEGGSNVQQLTQLLQQPNPMFNRSEFDELLRTFYDCTGDGFIWLNRGDVMQEYVPPTEAYVDPQGQLVQNHNGYFRNRTDEEIDRLPVIEMYVLPSGFVGVIPDPLNVFGIEGYWFDVNGKKTVIRRGDMIHWKRTNPVFDPTTGSHLRGLNPFQVIRRTIRSNADATASIDRMFLNDGAKGVLVNENLKWESLGEKERQNIRDMIDKRINNSEEIKGAVATLGGKWNYLNIAKDSVDVKLLEALKFTWRELCFAIKVPYEQFDPETTYNNKESAQKFWVSNSIIPARTNIDQKMTERLCLAFGLVDKMKNPTAVIWSDTTGLPEFKKDISALITAFQTAWWIPPNLKLLELGFDTSADPTMNEPWVPQGVMPLSEAKKEFAFNNQNDHVNEQGLNY
jgi:phage portal protein BeeE